MAQIDYEDHWLSEDEIYVSKNDGTKELDLQNRTVFFGRI